MHKISAKVILDAITQENTRLTTIEVVMPKFLVAQLNTHRALVKNSASSRAMPVGFVITSVLENYVTPMDFGMPANSRGMVAKSNLTGWRKHVSKFLWNTGMYVNIVIAYLQSKVGLHKAWANRPLEAYMYTKVLVTATEWENFFKLRVHKDAQDAMQIAARSIKDALTNHVPTMAYENQYYLPYVGILDNPTQSQINLSVSCCAQITYNRDLDESPDKAANIVAKLLGDTPHWSPFEHLAILNHKSKGSYKDWGTYRHLLENTI